MVRRAQAFDMTGGILSAYPWIRHFAPEYSGYNLLMHLNNEFKAILSVIKQKISPLPGWISHYFYDLQETIEEHKKNYVPGSDADLIDMFLTEMYMGKGPEAGFDGNSKNYITSLSSDFLD